MLGRILPALRSPRAITSFTKRTRYKASFCLEPKIPSLPTCCWSTLPNGVRVITEQITTPLACVTLFAEAGPRYEIPCNNGASHFFEHMAYRGLCTMPRCVFEEKVRFMGASFKVHTDREYQSFTCTCPHDVVPTVITMLYGMFNELACDAKEMENAKCDIYREMEDAERDHHQLCMDYLHKTAFQGTPLAQTVIGPWANYKLFDKEFLFKFVQQQYQPFRLIVSVASCYPHGDILQFCNCEFGRMYSTTNEMVYWPCRYTGSMVKFRHDEWPYCTMALAIEAGGFLSSEFVALQMMRHFTGKKWDASQHQGIATWPKLAHASEISHLCHHFESFYLPYKDVGLWGILVVMDKDSDYEDLTIMIQNEWMYMSTMLTQSDVQLMQNTLRLELAQQVDGVVQKCHDMGMQMMHLGKRKGLYDWYCEICKWNNCETRLLCDKVIYDRPPVLAAVGPTEAVPNYNRIRNGMYWLRY